MKIKHTKETKEQVIRQWKNKKSIVEIAKDVGVHRSTIYRWINEYESKLKLATKLKSPELKQLEKKIEKLQTMLQIIKEVDLPLSAERQAKLKAMEPLYKKFPTLWLCEALEIDRGTFLNHMLRNKKDNTWYAVRRENIKEAILKAYDDSNQIYGARKITVVLRQQGIKTSDKLVASLMHDMGLVSIRHRAKLNYEKELKFTNHIKREFKTSKPNEVWVSDVTYFRTPNLSYYLCVIIDLYSRKVISHKISFTNSTQLTKSTFLMAYKKRQPNEPFVLHTDRGSNYCSKTFANCIRKYNITHSFSQAGVPYDNSVVESFFASLKREKLYRTIFNYENDFKKAVDSYIVFYNSKRLHSSNGYKTPDEKESEFINKNDA